jgi:hypothetical protein
MTISLDEHVARAIYEAYGFAYDGRTINGRGQPYGEWAKALKASSAAIAAVREREGAEIAALRALAKRCHARALSVGAIDIENDIRLVLGDPALAPDPAEAMRAKDGK